MIPFSSKLAVSEITSNLFLSINRMVQCILSGQTGFPVQFRVQMGAPQARITVVLWLYPLRMNSAKEVISPSRAAPAQNICLSKTPICLTVIVRTCAVHALTIQYVTVALSYSCLLSCLGLLGWLGLGSLPACLRACLPACLCVFMSCSCTTTTTTTTSTTTTSLSPPHLKAMRNPGA